MHRHQTVLVASIHDSHTSIISKEKCVINNKIYIRTFYIRLHHHEVHIINK